MGISESLEWAASRGRIWRCTTVRTAEPPSNRDATTTSGVLSMREVEGKEGGRERGRKEGREEGRKRGGKDEGGERKGE